MKAMKNFRNGLKSNKENDYARNNYQMVESAPGKKEKGSGLNFG